MEIKLLVSISSCDEFEKNGLNEALRKTWIPEARALGVTCVFFHGKKEEELKPPKENPNRPLRLRLEKNSKKNDVVVLDVPDELYGLSAKAKEKAKWAVNNGFDFVFSCFPDTYLRIERLLKSGFNLWDYFGDVHQYLGGPPYCQGGCGYTLSRKACEMLYTAPDCYLNDDCFVGDVMNRNGIEAKHCENFRQIGEGPMKGNSVVCSHLSPRGLTISSMECEHKRWLASCLHTDL